MDGYVVRHSLPVAMSHGISVSTTCGCRGNFLPACNIACSVSSQSERRSALEALMGKRERVRMQTLRTQGGDVGV